MLSPQRAARGFAAAGSAPRLAVLQALVRAGPSGLTVGDIQARTGLAASTLAHHLRFLADGGLIVQERRGRTTVSCARFHHIEALAAYLLEECSVDDATADCGEHLHQRHA